MRAMKDSGIEWIGKIPENWGISPLRSKFSFGKGLSITKADLCEEGVPVISYGQIHSKDNSGVSAHESLIRHLPKDHENLSPTSLALKGDFIFADTSEDLQGCGNCVYIDKEYPIYAGYHTLIVHPKDEQTGKFYAYLFTCDAWRAQVRANVSGVKLYSITQDILRRTYLLDPPTDEQAKIVQYLDKKCTDIDLLIKAKEKSNALLKERRQSIIYEAVTKGLDPTVPMKDSGVEWIGEIPEKWELRKIKHNFDVFAGATPKSGETSFWDGDIPWITPADYTTEDMFVSAGKKSITQEGMDSCATNMIPEGSIVFSKRAPVGLVAITSNRLCTNQGCLSCVPRENIDTKYFYYTMSVFSNQFDLFASGTTFKEISSDSFANFKLPYPAYEIQREIAAYLDYKCSEFDSAVALNNSTIQKLKEYRQSLIYEAVTGKIEV